MKLTVQHVFNVTQILATIIREKRPLPIKGAYRVARLHAKLAPEFDTIAQKRDAMIMAYGHKARPDGAPDDVPEVPTVPADKMAEFLANWSALAAEEIEVAVEPIPLSQLDLGDDVAGSITAAELIVLGDLVVDDEPQPMPKAA